jgi:hypothetical protein
LSATTNPPNPLKAIMKLIRLLTVLATAPLAATAAAHDAKSPMTEINKGFLSQYETVRAALAADDLAAAKKAAAAMTDSQPAATLDAAKALANSDSLSSARDAFKVLSKRAVHLADSQAGYYHAHCPMVPNKEGDWVQTTKTISNPYMGKKMPKCGSIED